MFFSLLYLCPPNLSLLLGSILQLPDRLTEQAGGEVGWANVWKTHGGAIRSVTNMYSLGVPFSLTLFFSLEVKRTKTKILSLPIRFTS